MDKQAPGQQAPGQQGHEMQSRMFTLRLTPSQHARFVELANQAQVEKRLSCNTWILLQLGLISEAEANALTERLGLRGRKLRKTSQSNPGVKTCETAK